MQIPLPFGEKVHCKVSPFCKPGDDRQISSFSYIPEEVCMRSNYFYLFDYTGTPSPDEYNIKSEINSQLIDDIVDFIEK